MSGMHGLTTAAKFCARCQRSMFEEHYKEKLPEPKPPVCPSCRQIEALTAANKRLSDELELALCDCAEVSLRRSTAGEPVESILASRKDGHYPTCPFTKRVGWRGPEIVAPAKARETP